MQALRGATAAFCTACICAEVFAQLTGEGWPRRCIKAVAGLYILVVLLHALPGAKAELAAFSAPQAAALDIGTAEQNVLAEAERELELSVAARCRESTGVEVSLNITLAEAGGEVSVQSVQAALPALCTQAQREEAANFITRTLGKEPQLITEEDAP